MIKLKTLLSEKFLGFGTGQGKSIKESLKKSNINLSEEIKKLIKAKPNLSEKAYMGLIMGKFKGQVSGGEVMNELKKVSK